MGLWAKISGKGAKNGNIFCFVFGSDKRFVRRHLTTQGSHFQDDENRLAYFSSSAGVTAFRTKNNMGTKVLGPVSLAYELTTELYSFPKLDWIPDRLKPKGKQSGANGHHDFFEQDEVLDNGLAEGFAVAHQAQTDEETRRKLMQILLLTVLAAGALFFLVAASTGQLPNLFAGFSKVFGGG